MPNFNDMIAQKLIREGQITDSDKNSIPTIPEMRAAFLAYAKELTIQLAHDALVFAASNSSKIATKAPETKKMMAYLNIIEKLYDRGVRRKENDHIFFQVVVLELITWRQGRIIPLAGMYMEKPFDHDFLYRHFPVHTKTPLPKKLSAT